MTMNLAQRARARRASTVMKDAAQRPLPSAASFDAKRIRNTYPQLRCSMWWVLKSRLEFLCDLHGLQMHELVSLLLRESLPAFEALSREREDTAAKWSAFDAAYDEAVNADEFARLEREENAAAWLRDTL